MAGFTEEDGARRRPFWRELPVLITIALVLALLIKAFAVQAFRIPSGSMEDTLHIGDRVLVNKIVYDVGSIHRGDIVVFSGAGSWDPPAAASPPESLVPRLYHDVLRWVGLQGTGTDYIKRVIGVPGDHVVCCDANGRITVNGVALDESSYLFPHSDPSLQRFSVVVPPGRVWVMGDHRADSLDSRSHMSDPGEGTVPADRVVGRAFVVIWPLSQIQPLSTPTTFQQAALDSAAAATPVLPLAGGLGLAVPAVSLLRRRRARDPDRRRARAPGGA